MVSCCLNSLRDIEPPQEIPLAALRHVIAIGVDLLTCGTCLIRVDTFSRPTQSLSDLPPA
jgi:hypothetical protein